MQIDIEFNDRWQDVLKQINTENALAEEIRQYNESLEEEKRQFNEQMALQKEQFEYTKSKSSGGGGGSSGGGGGGGSKGGSGGTIKKTGGSGGSINKSGSTGDVNLKSVLDLGYGPISPSNLANKVAKGEVKETTKNGVSTFEKTGKTSTTKKSLTGTFGAISRLTGKGANR
jgi:hypothetical protein